MVATWQNPTINTRKDSESWQRKKRRKKKNRACWRKKDSLWKLKQISLRTQRRIESVLTRHRTPREIGGADTAHLPKFTN